jgi:hypothetical protein
MKLNVSKDELEAILFFAVTGIIKARDRQDQLGGFRKGFLDETQRKIEEIQSAIYKEE